MTTKTKNPAGTLQGQGAIKQTSQNMPEDALNVNESEPVNLLQERYFASLELWADEIRNVRQINTKIRELLFEIMELEHLAEMGRFRAEEHERDAKRAQRRYWGCA